MRGAPRGGTRLTSFARGLRRAQTDAESLLWSRLRGRRLAGIKFRRQHAIHGYTLDFYCAEARLGVELDGGQHVEEEERRYDQRRSEELLCQGVRVIRFFNNEVLTSTDEVLQVIYAEATGRAPGSEDPSP